MAQLMPLPLTVSGFSKIQIGFAFLVPAHPGSPGQRAVKWVCVCVCCVIEWKSRGVWFRKNCRRLLCLMQCEPGSVSDVRFLAAGVTGSELRTGRWSGVVSAAC